jgi:hypothetical protein
MHMLITVRKVIGNCRSDGSGRVTLGGVGVVSASVIHKVRGQSRARGEIVLSLARR